MFDTLTLGGAVTTRPTFGSPSGLPSLEIPLGVVRQLQNKSIQQFTLDANVAEPVQMPSAFTANVLCVNVVGGAVLVELTYTAPNPALPVGYPDLLGSTQTVVVDSQLILVCDWASIAALNLYRQPGVQVNVQIFLGQKAE